MSEMEIFYARAAERVTSLLVDRIAEAKDSPEFASVLATCRECEQFAESGWTCRQACCGGRSVRLQWAAQAGCPLGKWRSDT